MSFLQFMDLVQKFWSRVNKADENDCWLWNAGKTKRYGYFFVHPRNQLAHRVAWMFTYGEIPDGKVICHKCDNTFCCNPNHLFIGTQADNVKDMEMKGRRRAAIGEKAAKAKLTEDDVRGVFDLYHRGMKLRQIAAHYGVTKTTIDFILAGKSWKHLGLKKQAVRRFAK